jgi:hypothetical protein
MKMISSSFSFSDANVSMVLFGEKGDTGQRKLDTNAVRLL